MKENTLIFERYITLIEQAEHIGVKERVNQNDISFAHLKSMCDTAIREITNENWSCDKSSRWLGYVQCGVIVQGLTTVEEERDFTRPIFHKYYEKNNLNIPESIDLQNK